MNGKAGFTLVELVIVILILGIVAGAAAPKMFDVHSSAVDSGLRQTLSIVRDAIEVYAADHDGALAGSTDGTEATFKSDLAPYLRTFPSAPVGTAKGDDRVNMKGTGAPLSGNTTPSRAWKYDYTTGQFIINYNGISCDGVTSYEDF